MIAGWPQQLDFGSIWQASTALQVRASFFPTRVLDLYPHWKWGKIPCDDFYWDSITACVITMGCYYQTVFCCFIWLEDIKICPLLHHTLIPCLGKKSVSLLECLILGYGLNCRLIFLFGPWSQLLTTLLILLVPPRSASILQYKWHSIIIWRTKYVAGPCCGLEAPRRISQNILDICHV